MQSQERLHDQVYVMEANCPHLGADMSHAEIEECDTGVVAVCPWHRYVVVTSSTPIASPLNCEERQIRLRLEDGP